MFIFRGDVISAVSPLIEKNRAQELLARGAWKFSAAKPILRVELFYLPSYLIKLQVSANNEEKQQHICVDALDGVLAFIDPINLTFSRTENIKTCPYFLPQEKAESLAVEQYRRHLLQSSLQTRVRMEVKRFLSTSSIYYPFWIGFFKRKGKLDFRVIDAVSGQMQGAAVKPVFIKALLQEKVLEQD